ncbi:MAG TPA: peptidylprolyl isomerase [Bacteroidia bacterium]|nr:peptidylprolyl isomerase [Bacteroidia bacterium]
MFKKILFGFIILGISSCGLSQSGKSKEVETKVKIRTTMGDIVVKLYNQTPQTRDNFIKLVNQKFYDSTLFHRVIEGFMIQGGDPNSKKAPADVMLGNGDVGYTVPAEIVPGLFHKKGALATARQGDQVNPSKASSGCQFYIVQGKKFRNGELDTMEERANFGIKQQIFTKIISKPENTELKRRFIKYQNESAIDSLQALTKTIEPQIDSIYAKTDKFKFTPEERAAYTAVGGTPQLDNNYTVFGEVIEGLDIVDKIAGVKTNQADRPLTDVRILSAEIVK